MTDPLLGARILAPLRKRAYCPALECPPLARGFLWGSVALRTLAAPEREFLALAIAHEAEPREAE
jgi:hypothetical protein